ncbi:NADPH-dependent FMN reductase [Sphaerochaeta associata]|uniref:NAD(P)H-dependent oxidoreductase n=1 Tax=Sphaerochaeta associata TaxID=1129264 RepID=A0ABY4DCU2_9SPIR|nr:NAD(P)H-dependent oxidoreductase [Sphaerochaeta associata]UOM51298.1 NAD(P)H-dependent oxidoreductase [Sphaerochaeta associata]SMP51259.1 NADPH-dependent FMN reductase [Sphaerochaeta associata]
MKHVVVRECGDFDFPCGYELDLNKTELKDCLGCWSCWLKTPGRCVHSDLNEFYKAYLAADKVVIFSKVSHGFVSGNLKTLFDRIIPLYLPYLTFKSGESMHVPRYESYPEVEVYYEGEFSTPEDQTLYVEYIHRVFYQFYSTCKVVKPLSEFPVEERLG